MTGKYRRRFRLYARYRSAFARQHSGVRRPVARQCRRLPVRQGSGRCLPALPCLGTVAGDRIALALRVRWDGCAGAESGPRDLGGIVLRGGLINILNPKLSIFFLIFLPQFVPVSAPDALARTSILSATFMALTFMIFVGYGVAADAVRSRVLSSERTTRWMQRAFAGAFAAFAAKLALTDR